MSIPIYIEVDPDVIIEHMMALPDDEVFEFIKNLDYHMGDYDFTKRLQEHFNHEIEYEEEMAKKRDVKIFDE